MATANLNQIPSKKYWHSEHTLYLIDLYRQCEDLYNKKSPFYDNEIIKQNYLIIITQKLKTVRPTTTVKDVKSRIKKLRERFLTHLLNIPDTVTDPDPESKLAPNELWCFQELLFLKEHIQSNNDLPNSTSTLSLLNTSKEDQDLLFKDISPLNFNFNKSTQGLQPAMGKKSQSLEVNTERVWQVKNVIENKQKNDNSKQKIITIEDKSFDLSSFLLSNNYNDQNNREQKNQEEEPSKTTATIDVSTKNASELLNETNNVASTSQLKLPMPNLKNIEYQETSMKEVREPISKDDPVLKSLANTLQILAKRPEKEENQLKIFGQYVEAELATINDVNLLKQCRRAISKAILNFQELDDEFSSKRRKIF